MLHHIFFIHLIISLIDIINGVVVENENDVINYLSKSNNKVTLITNSEIEIMQEIVMNESIEKLSINGNSLDSAKLNLKYPLHFNTNLKEIEIKNININGTLFFKKNNKIITIDNVNLYGYIDSDFDNNSNNNIEITKFTYKPLMESVENCINLSGNIKIDKSNFYGNSLCRNRLFHYNGFA